MPDFFYFDCQRVYRASVLDEVPWIEHGFGTRLSTAWPGERALTTVRQIHSDRVIVSDGTTGNIGEGDALIAQEPGTLIAIRTADCLPILIGDRKRRVVAAVHAGWRGTVSKIAAKTVKAMHEQFGSEPKDLVAAIGPGIARCCFEVGPEVAEQFAPFEPVRTQVDLGEENRRQLRDAGVEPARIVTSRLCTCCGGDVFHSFRRDREASGRMVAAIGIRNADAL